VRRCKLPKACAACDCSRHSVRYANSRLAAEKPIDSVAVAFAGDKDVLLALIVVALSFGLYFSTVAPTVLWGDDGHLQLTAVLGIVQGSAGSHPLWVWIAHMFTRFLGGDIARRVNLVSSVFGSVTLGFLYLFLRELRITRPASVLAVLVFSISHTFWQHAVRAEVYTLVLSMMVCLGWLSLRWFHTQRPQYLVIAAFVSGLGLTAHLMIGLFAPGILWLLFRRRQRVSDLVWCVVAFVVGLTPLGIMIARDAAAMDLQGLEIVRWALFSFEGYDFSSAMFDFDIRFLAEDTFQWLFFLGLQFVGLAGISGIVGCWRIWKDSSVDHAVYILLLYLSSLAFAFAYRVGDRYVFYLPSYLPFVAWIGFGLDYLLEVLSRRIPKARLRRLVFGALSLSLIAVPIVSYRAAPALVDRGLTFRDTRHVPGPNGKYFFLWPSLAGYFDCRDYAESALRQAPENALLLADPILASPLRFLQGVEGRRPDVRISYCCWDIDEVIGASAGRPIVLAGSDPRVYPMERLQDEYRIVPLEPVYLLSGN